ncbi:MAG TPA: prepilin-type N-terminal cleavage/methylation domain-containing protein [Planctomycetaceae bacterium]|nr:prepilin-type N-terminal cleavage/methylation domain-containing protein [Planctomycetaceae bacterium]
MRRNRCHRMSASRRGLTLVEMMLAALLSMVLLGGVYGALTQSWRYTTQGKLEAERNQIARAVLRRIELDIRAAMFDPKAAAATTDTSTVTSASSTSTGTSTSGSTSSSSGTGSLGIRGSSTELWIDLSHVQRDLVFPDPTIIKGGDLQTVCWFLNGPGSVLGESASATTTSSGFTRVDLDGINLARSQGDRSVLRTLNAGGDSDTVLPGPTQVVAGEINALTFRYFDGLTWYEEWDSSTTTALPRAIEVTLGFDPPSNTDGPLLTSSVSAATATFRMVIVVPASNPAPPEDI